MSQPTPAEIAATLRQFDIEAFTFLAVASCMTILRTYIRAKAVGLRSLQLDDYFAWLGTVRLIYLKSPGPGSQSKYWLRAESDMPC